MAEREGELHADRERRLLEEHGVDPEDPRLDQAIRELPYAAALGLFVALTDLIPLVGATIGAVVCSAVALTVAPGTGVVAVVFFIVSQQFENFAGPGPTKRAQEPRQDLGPETSSWSPG